MKYDKLTSVTVNPGDLGTRFLVFNDPEKGRVNRVIAKEKVSEYGRNIDHIAAHGLPLYLVSNGKADVYYIFDGQHRIAAASKGQKPVTFDAVIIKDTGQNISEELMGAHETKRFAMADRFFVSQHRSIWPDAAKKAGLDVVFVGGGQLRWKWSAIIPGRLAADRIKSRGNMLTETQIKAEAQMACWTETTEQKALATLAALQWWEGCIQAYAKVNKAAGRVMRSADVTSCVLIIFETNHFDLLKNAARYIANPKNDDLAGQLANRSFAERGRAVIRAINFGRHDDSGLATLLGITGR